MVIPVVDVLVIRPLQTLPGVLDAFEMRVFHERRGCVEMRWSGGWHDDCRGAGRRPGWRTIYQDGAQPDENRDIANTSARLGIDN
jgi:hypothetical protein